ncbi:MAG: response regulator [Flavitalea sp.]
MYTNFFLIDDDPDELDIFAEALTEVDPRFTCTWANSPSKALDILQDKTPDVIFLDINMPRMDGYECLQEIKKIDNVANVPVIMYSNGINTEACNRALALGAAGCVRKAADIPKLTNIIRNVIMRTDTNTFFEV